MLRRLIGEDIAPRASPLRRRASAGARRPRADRAGDHEPGRQRPRRDAGRRQAARSRPRNVELDAAYAAAARRARSRAATSMLAVSDTGIGMDADDAGADLRAVLHDQGAGQGHRARARHRATASSSRAAGTSGVYSEPGAGTTFKVYLPRLTEDLADVGAARCPRRPAAGHRDHPAGRGRGGGPHAGRARSCERQRLRRARARGRRPRRCLVARDARRTGSTCC